MAAKSPARKKARKGTGRRKAPEIAPITSEEALAFIRRVQEKFPAQPKTRRERAEVQEYLAQFSDRVLKSVGSRVQGDLMLRPPRTIGPGEVAKRRRRAPVSRKKAK